MDDQANIVLCSLFIGAIFIICHGIIKDRKCKYHDMTKRGHYGQGDK